MSMRTDRIIPALCVLATLFALASPAQAQLCDCNGNGIDDTTDIADTTSADANINGIPDECEVAAACPYQRGDLNGDTIIDGLDVFAFTNCYFTGDPVPTGICACADINADGVLDATDDTLFSMFLIDALALDQDGDLAPDGVDNCEFENNPDQLDTDADGVGDACENCLITVNSDQADSDNDGIGDACDNCPGLCNAGQADTDLDGIGDDCDNCDGDSNPGQSDGDADGEGDACDNCPDIANADQSDNDTDGIGNACDNCPNVANADQADADSDGTGNACETDGEPQAPPAGEVPQDESETEGEPGAGQTLPGGCDPDSTNVSLLFSVLMGAPVCGTGCLLAVPMLLAALIGQRGIRRHWNRR